MIDEYLESLRVRNLSEGTITYREIHIRHFMTFLHSRGSGNITQEAVNQYEIELTRGAWAVSTRIHALHSVESFLKFLGLALRVTYPKKRPREIKSILTEDEIMTLLELPDTKTPAGIRDRAMLELLYSSGIRRHELVQMNLYDLEEGSLRVLGKGRKERIVPVGEVAMQWLKVYLFKVRRDYAKSKERAFFVSLVTGKRLHPHTLNLLFRVYRKAGRFTKRLTPHVIRHSVATHMLRRGASLRHVQELLGHRSARTTEIYTHVDIGDLKDVHKRAHPRGAVGGRLDQPAPPVPTGRDGV